MDDFRLHLQREFVQRCQKNRKYSLRAFARSLGVEPSPLSAMLRGKRPISLSMRQRIGLALGMNLEEIERYDSNEPKVPVQQLTLDAYAVIADWYHYAILELIKVKDFEGDLTYLSKTLSISRTEAQIAVERLQRLNLLEIKKNKWIDRSSDFLLTNINDDLTSQGSRKLQKQVLEKAIQALEELPPAVRNHTSLTVAVNQEDLDEAKKRIRKFRRELNAFFEKNKKPTHVYHLSLSLYPITRGEK